MRKQLLAIRSGHSFVGVHARFDDVVCIMFSSPVPECFLFLSFGTFHASSQEQGDSLSACCAR